MKKKKKIFFALKNSLRVVSCFVINEHIFLSYGLTDHCPNPEGDNICSGNVHVFPSSILVHFQYGVIESALNINNRRPSDILAVVGSPGPSEVCPYSDLHGMSLITFQSFRLVLCATYTTGRDVQFR